MMLVDLGVELGSSNHHHVMLHTHRERRKNIPSRKKINYGDQI